MRIVGRAKMWALVAATVLMAGAVQAGNNPNGIVFRAVGFFGGEAEISGGGIKCEIPDIEGAIADGAFSMGLWNTYGSQTLFFPDTSNPFGNPCGGWVQVQSNLLDQGLNVERVDMRMSIAGAGRFRQFVPTRNKFPIACRDFRRQTLFVGTRLSGSNSMVPSSGSGAPNVAFMQMLPMVSPQLLACLRSQYAGLSTDMFVSLPVVIRARVTGRADSGEVYVSNTIRYTLTLRHTCGNGRVDDGEECDPNTATDGGSPITTCLLGACENGLCGSTNIPCVTAADCTGDCANPDNPGECTCSF